jgi:hypothetical protein
MKKVVFRVKGGLGNQLFIYAFGKVLEKKYNYTVKYDLKTGFVINHYKHIETNKSLLQFYFKDVSKITLLDQFFYQISRKTRSKKLFNIKYINKEVNNIDDFINELDDQKLSYYLEGYYQSSELISKVLPEIRSNINLNYFLDKEGLDLCDRIKNQNSVAIQIRVNDYPVDYDPNFFKNSIQLINKNIDKPKFYLFSDNVKWCQDNLILPENIKVINTGSDMKDFSVLTSCNNFILSVGTFGWWGAILSNNPDKLIIASERYKNFINDNFYPKDWIIL